MILTAEEYLGYLIKRTVQPTIEKNKEYVINPFCSSSKWLGIIPFSLKLFGKKK